MAIAKEPLLDLTGSDRIVRQNLRDLVTARIFEMIRAGVLKPGDQFPSEREQMGKFGVGRPAVREAMLTLANWGLVSIVHGQASEVRDLSAASVLAAIREPLFLVISQSDQLQLRTKHELKMLEGLLNPDCIPSNGDESPTMANFPDQSVSLLKSIHSLLTEILRRTDIGSSG